MSEVHSDQLKQALSRAIEYHRAGELELAEQAYEEVLKIDSEQPDALHLSEKGYHIWAEAIEPTLKRLLGAR